MTKLCEQFHAVKSYVPLWENDLYKFRFVKLILSQYSPSNKKKSTIILSKLPWTFGGPEEDRTLDLTDANRTLSQLSYGPVSLSNGIIHHPKENFKSK